MFEKPESTTVSVGVTTKPYPTWRLPGNNQTKIAFEYINIYQLRVVS